MEFHGKSWYFIDPQNPQNKVAFEQAIVDSTFANRTRVDGFVKSVHGVDQEIAKFFDSPTRLAMGITAAHQLGRGRTVHRLRLSPDGSIEKVGAM